MTKFVQSWDESHVQFCERYLPCSPPLLYFVDSMVGTSAQVVVEDSYGDIHGYGGASVVNGANRVWACQAPVVRSKIDILWLFVPAVQNFNSCIARSDWCF